MGTAWPPFAKSRLTSTVSTIRLADGIYTLVSEFVVDAAGATVVGGREAVVQCANLGSSFHVKNGRTLTLRGFVLERGVECTNATLSMVGLSFDHPTAKEIRSWVSSTDCSTSITDSQFIGSLQHGITASEGSLTVTGTRVEGSAGHGIVCTTATCSITTSRIIGNQLVGVDATPIALELGRSVLTENVQGGVRTIGGTCDITNNFVFRNGNDADGTFGGMRLEPSAGGSHRIEHN
ncbi:MAG: hypothetical protein H0V17_14120, partial [Deltaproteobacteria bacterium]|nr:hypothetical protein [Deltaproteobacteria bacterium]